MNIGELAKFRGGIATDTISEVTSASGVTIDSVLCKDGSVTGAASGTFTTTYVKAADTQGLALVNSSGTSVVTVTEAGAVTAGASSPGDATITHTMNCAILRIDNRDSTSGTDAYLSYRLIGTEKYQAGLSGTDYFVYSNTAAANVALCSSAGAWTWGPASGLTVAHLVRASSPTSNIVFKIQNTSNSDCFMQLYGSSGALSLGSANGQAYFEGISGKTSSGGVAVLVNASNLLGTSTSVREAKTNIQPLGSTIGWLKRLKPYVYQYRKQVDGKYTDEAEDFVNTGLIYDEVVQVNPQLCFDTADGKPSGVEYTRLITPLLKAFQEQQAMIEELKAEVAALKAK